MNAPGNNASETAIYSLKSLFLWQKSLSNLQVLLPERHSVGENADEVAFIPDVTGAGRTASDPPDFL